METVFSNALTGCNLGAAVGGADFNPHNKSEAEIQRCARMCVSLRGMCPAEDRAFALG